MGYFILAAIGIILGTIGGWLQSELLLVLGTIFCVPAALRFGWWLFKNS